MAEGPHDVPMIVPLVVKGSHWNLRTGPVVRMKGGKGARGRLHSLAALKRNLVTLIEPLTEEDLRIHLLAYRNPQNPRPKQSWLLPPAIADQIFSAFVNGTLADLLREQDFRWNWEEQRPAICNALARYFDEEARLHSDALDDVLKGAQQARKCATFIEQMGLEVFAKRRFPKHSAPIERIELVVVTSVRAFSGCEIDGVPIRDWLTFRNVLLDGAIEVATQSGGSLLVRRSARSAHHCASGCPAKESIEICRIADEEGIKEWQHRRSEQGSHDVAVGGVA